MVPTNPAVPAFTALIARQPVWGQLFIERAVEAFQLRHVADQELSPEKLQPVTLPGLRKLAMFNRAGQFRPLRAAPDLRQGWICTCRSENELARAVQEIYPGSIFDWFATVQSTASPTGYREFTNRQSGMYRITQLLTDDQASQVIRACCGRSLCLKRRFWTVAGLEPDSSANKSSIPCLEPCAVLLELARKAARIERENKITLQIPASDLDTLISATRIVATEPVIDEKTGNIGSALNARRVQLVLEKYAKAVDGSTNHEEE